MSGCLFAAYGPSADNITVEHVNVRHPQAAAVPILPRAIAIIGAHHAFYKILSPVIVPNADPTHVKVYGLASAVVGVKVGGAWNFWYKPTLTTVALL